MASQNSIHPCPHCATPDELLTPEFLALLPFPVNDFVRSIPTPSQLDLANMLNALMPSVASLAAMLAAAGWSQQTTLDEMQHALVHLASLTSSVEALWKRVRQTGVRYMADEAL